MTALEIVAAEKTRGIFLYIQKLFGRLFVGAFQMICAFVERCGEISSKVIGAAGEEKASAKIAARNAKVFTALTY
jgi:hypothetical protein